MEMFAHKEITPHIIRIQDQLGVFMYLIIGDEKACLLDTGYGYGDIKNYVERLTDKPIFVILTHGHIDHAGGAGLFNEVYMNPKDKTVFQQHMDNVYRRRFLKFNNISVDVDTFVPVKDVVDLLPMQDGQEWELGGITLQAIEVPGHTHGMTMILMKEERTILFGDGCGVNVLLFEDYSTSVQTYYESLQRLKTKESTYDYIIRNHGTGESEKDLLDEVLLCCEDILQKRDAHIPVHIMGEDLYSAREEDEYNNRIDGKFGNVVYRIDKV